MQQIVRTVLIKPITKIIIIKQLELDSGRTKELYVEIIKISSVIKLRASSSNGASNHFLIHINFVQIAKTASGNELVVRFFHALGSEARDCFSSFSNCLVRYLTKTLFSKVYFQS